MFGLQIAAELITLIVFSVIIFKFMKLFKPKKELYLVVFFIMISFVIGFFMRLSGIKGWVDLGYFFTEFSYIMIWLLGVFCWAVGQLKYCKVK